jgi:hypothetical protein
VAAGADDWREGVRATLVARRAIDDAAFAEAIAREARFGGVLSSHLVDLGTDGDEVLRALATACGLPPAPPSLVTQPDCPPLPGVDGALCWRLRALPSR